VEEEGLIN